MAIHNGAFSVPLVGTRFRGLDTRITFEPDMMVVPAFQLLDENGERMHIEGRLPYRSGRLGDVTIAVRSANFEVIDNDMADAQVSTDLTITGTLTAPRLEGTVRITDGEIRVDRILDRQAERYYRVAPRAETTAIEVDAAAEEGVLRNAPGALDLRLEVPALLMTGRDLRGPGSIPIGLGDIN
jgi:hypothetical protein